ncbi:MAG: carboxypeptidase-like regulatory domain-containing protein, partial [Bacteroidetes bacterium]|nr:carboxypeptidase-like regulatory domain-containing protein [Bacteroidota bacterium]
MKYFLFLIAYINITCAAYAGKISGTVTDSNGIILPYASILVKGTSKGTTANNEGKYFLNLDPGKYTII